MVFSLVFVVLWVGAIVVSVNAQLLGGKLSLPQSVCVLGWRVPRLCAARLTIGVVETMVGVSRLVRFCNGGGGAGLGNARVRAVRRGGRCLQAAARSRCTLFPLLLVAELDGGRSVMNILVIARLDEPRWRRGGRLTRPRSFEYPCVVLRAKDAVSAPRSLSLKVGMEPTRTEPTRVPLGRAALRLKPALGAAERIVSAVAQRMEDCKTTADSPGPF